LRYILIISLFFILPFCKAQNIREIPFKGSDFTTDHIGFFYVYNNKNIYKYTDNGKLLFTYSNNQLGDIEKVDVTNPLKIIVYYKDFLKLVILDNTLSISGDVIDLNTFNFNNIVEISRSYNNGYWLFDIVNQELFRKNEYFETTNSSGNLSLTLNKEVIPVEIIEYNNKVYLNDTTMGILVFNQYGNYIKTIPIKGVQNFQVKDQYMIYTTNQNNAYVYYFMEMEHVPLNFDLYPKIKKIRIENELMYILTSDNRLIIKKIDF
jgi:hypothetical protein